MNVRTKLIILCLFFCAATVVYGGQVMTKISVTVDTAKPVTVSVLLKDSTDIYINDSTMKQIFGPEAHLQVTDKTILACVADACVPISKKSKKGDVIEEKGEWYLHLNSYTVSIGKIFRWIEPGKAIEIISGPKQ